MCVPTKMPLHVETVVKLSLKTNQPKIEVTMSAGEGGVY